MESKVEYEVGAVTCAGCNGATPGLTFSSPEAATGLSKRLAKAVLAIGAVEKRGRNEYFKYDFATSEDIKAVARKALADAEIGVIPALVSKDVTVSGQTRAGRDNLLYRVRWLFTLVFPEGYVHIPWESESLDDQDKGLTKAGTSALKYFLIDLLQIPTGDDLDPDSEKGTGGNGSAKIDKATADAVMASDRPFASAEAAIAWGYDQGAFKAKAHAKNAYAKLKEEKQPTNAAEMAELWRAEVAEWLAKVVAGEDDEE